MPRFCVKEVHDEYALAATYSDDLGYLGRIPVLPLAVMVVGVPLTAAAAGWLLAGPPAVHHRPAGNRMTGHRFRILPSFSSLPTTAPMTSWSNKLASTTGRGSRQQTSD